MLILRTIFCKESSADSRLRSVRPSDVAANTRAAVARRYNLQTSKSRLEEGSTVDRMATPRRYLERVTHWVVNGSYVAAFLVLVAALVLTFEGQLWVDQVGGVSVDGRFHTSF